MSSPYLLVCDCGNRAAISKPGVFFKASIAHQLGRQILLEQRRPVHFPFAEHRPGDAGKFVGQGHGDNIPVCA